MRRPAILRILALCLILLALLPAAPARAGTTGPFDLIASATQTATAQGGQVSVTGIKELIVFANCTASSSPTQLDLYLQTSSDGGTTWYDLTADVVQQTNAAAAETAATTNKRDVFEAVTTCASPVRAIGKYTVFGGLVRVAWVITGTSFTFGVKAIGKN